MADRIVAVSRALNDVGSVGQARAAIAAAQNELDVGLELAPTLSLFSTPDPDEAIGEINILRAALAGEIFAMGSMADDQHVDAATWDRARRQIERTYVEVSGIEGTSGAVARIRVGEILADAIANAPRVFAEAVGETVAGAGRIVGSAGGGLLSGLGFVGVLVVIIVAALVLRPKFGGVT
jgi:hypothetical protein